MRTTKRSKLTESEEHKGTTSKKFSGMKAEVSVSPTRRRVVSKDRKGISKRRLRSKVVKKRRAKKRDRSRSSMNEDEPECEEESVNDNLENDGVNDDDSNEMSQEMVSCDMHHHLSIPTQCPLESTSSNVNKRKSSVPRKLLLPSSNVEESSNENCSSAMRSTVEDARESTLSNSYMMSSSDSTSTPTDKRFQDFFEPLDKEEPKKAQEQEDWETMFSSDDEMDLEVNENELLEEREVPNDSEGSHSEEGLKVSEGDVNDPTNNGLNVDAEIAMDVGNPKSIPKVPASNMSRLNSEVMCDKRVVRLGLLDETIDTSRRTTRSALNKIIYKIDYPHCFHCKKGFYTHNELNKHKVKCYNGP